MPTDRPKTVLHAETDDCRTVSFRDGRVFADVRLAVTPEAMDEITHGARCAYCLEPQESARPERCSLCGFEIRERQSEYIANHLVDDMHIGSRINLADEAERLRELNDYEERTGLVLPDNVKYPTEIIRH